MDFRQRQEWAERRNRIRIRMHSTLSKIREGVEIEEEEFYRLWNFVMTMCWLLGKVSPGTLDAAIKEVEAAAWITGGMDDGWDIAMDSEVVA